MKMKIVLMALVAVFAMTGSAMAAPTPGCYDITGIWNESLVGGQGGQAGNMIFAMDVPLSDWSLIAELTPPVNPASAPWSWDTTYNINGLTLTPNGPWNSTTNIFATDFELRVLSTGYDQQAGTLAWKMSGSGVLDTGNPFTMCATFGNPTAPGTPWIIPSINTPDISMGGDLTTARICIGPIDTTKPIPAPGAILLGTMGAGLVGWLRRRRTL